MKRLYKLLFFSAFLLFSITINSQTTPEIGDLSDDEVAAMWEQAQLEGFTIEQFKTLAIARGIASSQVNELVTKINNLGVASESGDQSNSGEVESSTSLNINPLVVPNGHTGSVSSEGTEGKNHQDVKSRVFGMEFFNNPNITFAPNLNLATPSNYEVGPGDKFSIHLWGAAENTYIKEVNREGFFDFDGVGPIYVNGLNIDAAKSQIKGKLRKVYSGITASKNSPYKINVDISLMGVRTVQVNIIGNIKVPGTYSLSSLSTVLNALYAAGGPTEEGTFRDVKLVRNGEVIARFDIYNYLLKGSQVGNNTLQDQDVIIISPYLSRIIVGGAVKRPGVFELKPNETLNNLLKYTGGFKSNAFKDRMIVERISGDRRIVKEMFLTNANREILNDGDFLMVNEIIEKFKNRVMIKGAVFRPGIYEYKEGLTVKDVIEKAAGLREEAFLNRGQIISTEDGITRTSQSFSVSNVLNGTVNINIKVNDVITIYNKYNIKEGEILSIDGAVNNPTSIPFVDNMTIEDLVIMAGGFKDAANTGVINVFRKIKDNEFETLSKTYEVTANGALTLGDNEKFILQPNDRVSVRFLKGFTEQKKVQVNGEVNYPGGYIIEMKNERISDLVERAGGLSPYAFLEGASLIRINPYFKDVAVNNVLDNINRVTMDSTAINKSLELMTGTNLNNKQSFKVGIDLEKILSDDGKNSKFNLVLQDGDRLEIPSVKETVKVQGEILAPSLIRYDKTNTLKDYINKSGGFSLQAKKSKTYVIYSNGDIASSKNFLFFRSYPKLKPGALIIVPIKPLTRQVSAQEIIGITTGLTTLGLLIDRFSR